MDSKNLLIKYLIRQIHKELIESQKEREAEGLEPLFTVESLKIEANFIAVDDQKAEAGFGFHLLKAGAKVNYKQEQIHKITLNLTTIDQDDTFPSIQPVAPCYPESVSIHPAPPDM